jgi:GNAT superfamily N-acetyltransferase
VVVRAAGPADVETLAAFNRAMAAETEGKELDLARLRAGTEAVFADPARGRYVLAERAAEGGRATPVGCLLLTYEWSDWRNGVFWWIQSVYVDPAARGTGVFRRLYEHVHELARATPGVCGLRLYVERENELAQCVYRAVGMAESPYRLFEVDFVLGGSGAP